VVKDRYVFEIPRSIKEELKRKYSCCICGRREELEIHHLDKFPKRAGLRVNVLYRRCHRAVTYLEMWYPQVYHRVLVPFLETCAITIDLERLFPKLTAFLGGNNAQ